MTTFSKETALGLAEVLDVADREMTPGEWRAANGKGSACVRADDPEVACAIYLNVRTVEVDECVERWQRDARSIASLRNHARQVSEQLRAAVEEVERLKADFDREEKWCDDVLEERDARVEQINRIADALGDEGEWSNLHDRGDAAFFLATDAVQEVERLRAERSSLLAEREQLRGEVARMERHVAHNDEEYRTMKDVLRAEHEECKRLRALLATPCDTEVTWHNNGRGGRVVFEVGSEDYVVTAERAVSLGAALLRTGLEAQAASLPSDEGSGE